MKYSFTEYSEPKLNLPDPSTYPEGATQKKKANGKLYFRAKKNQAPQCSEYFLNIVL